jgi:hypothetical protein
VFEINGKNGNEWITDRSKWHGSFMFVHPAKKLLANAWKTEFSLNQIAPGSYLCVALNGVHGIEGAYASMKVDGKLYGALNRAPSFSGMPWEHTIQNTNQNYTFFIPLTSDMIGKKIEVFILGFEGFPVQFQPELWITAYPIPMEIKHLLMK